MWILSQDKLSLEGCDRICVLKTGENRYTVLGNGYKTLGIYSTEAKAKKVLEWCYEQIVRKDSPNILAMPQEDEI
nr:MAG TPA: hypothetical protein [Caudoviricetes sp.]